MTSRRISPAVPQGVQTFLFEETRRRTDVGDELFQVLQGWSYQEIALPVFDFFDVFAEGAGPSLVEKTFRFVDREGQLVAVRSDFTPLVARTVATRLSDAALPLRICYRGDVVRHEPARAGAQSDFWQIGAELIGAPGADGVLEILAVAADALDAIGIDDFVLSLGHVGVLAALLDGVGLEADVARAIRRAIDRKDPRALEAALGAAPGLDAHVTGVLRALPGWYGGAEVLATARRELQSKTILGALDELAEIADVYTSARLPGRLAIDLGDVRGTGYYTGPKFQVFAPGLGVSLGGGGRYDDLIGRFGDEQPAVGFSLSLDRLVYKLHGRDAGEAEQTRGREIEIDPDGRAAALREAREARAAGDVVRLKGSE